MKPDDAHLIAACQRKDQRAFRQLYERYAGQMFAICVRYTQTNTAAEDVMHDAFIKIFDNIGDLQSPEALVPWMRSIMVRTALNSIRCEDPIREIPDDNHLADTQVVSEEIAYDNIDIEVILAAIRRLPDRCREAFNLSVVEGYSNEEVADLMHISQTGVRTLLSRARRALSAELKNNRK